MVKAGFQGSVTLDDHRPPEMLAVAGTPIVAVDLLIRKPFSLLLTSDEHLRGIDHDSPSILNLLLTSLK